ncbi:MAG: hypothetical protein M3O30_14700 [Planctomycetota bacterium]|nr:hypothetical protein [Planctomycetota bacterium]
MPPVSPTMQLVDKNAKRVWPGRITGVQRLEGLYSVELHYRASDLRAIERFDIARTYEHFWGYDNNERQLDYCPLVVSKRFYDLCQCHNLKVDWLPVHIDPI